MKIRGAHDERGAGADEERDGGVAERRDRGPEQARQRAARRGAREGSQRELEDAAGAAVGRARAGGGEDAGRQIGAADEREERDFVLAARARHDVEPHEVALLHAGQEADADDHPRRRAEGQHRAEGRRRREPEPGRRHGPRARDARPRHDGGEEHHARGEGDAIEPVVRGIPPPRGSPGAPRGRTPSRTGSRGACPRRGPRGGPRPRRRWGSARGGASPPRRRS